MRIPFLKRAGRQTSIAAFGPWNAGVPLYPPRNYRTFALEAFSRNPLVYACIKCKAQSASDIRLKAEQLVGGDWVAAEDTTRRTPEADELQALLDNPNDNQDQTEWLMDSITHLQTAGNAYTQIELSGAGRPVALWCVPRPDVMAVVPDDLKGIGGYVYNVGREAIALDVSQVIHFRDMTDPLNPLLGLSPIVVLAAEIDADNAATQFLKQYFDKGGIPALIALFKKRTSEEQAKLFRADWEKRFSVGQGGNAAGGVFVANADEVEIQKIGSTTGSREMGLTEIRQVIEARICAAFRVHPQVAFTMLGFMHPTYAQARVADEATWQQGYMPMYTRLAGKITIKMRPFYPHCRVVTDYSKVTALAEDTDALWSRHQTAFDSGAETREEFRDAVKLPDEPKGIFYVPFNRIEQKPGEPLAPRVTATETVPATVADIEAQENEAQGTTDAQANQRAPHVAARERTGKPKPAPAPSKALKAASPKAQAHADRLASLRETVAGDIEPRLGAYFADLSERVVHRLRSQDNKTIGIYLATKDAYPFDEDDLLPPAESKRLAAILAPLWLAALKAAWEATASEFELDEPFDASAAIVAQILRAASNARVSQITEATRSALRKALADGVERGYSVTQLADGVAADGFGGIASLVEELYSGRAATIIRTEVSWAANMGTLALAKVAGIDSVEVSDGDYDEPCKDADGQTWTLDEAEANPLEHPSCVRSFAPVTAGGGDEEAED